MAATWAGIRQEAGLGEGMAAAWRRLWHWRDSQVPAPRGQYWTSGVTYRGYLGADGQASASWRSEDEIKETHALLRMAAAAGRLGAWSLELDGMKWRWSDEVKVIHEVPLHYEPTTEDSLAFYSHESREILIDAFDTCAREGAPFDLELQMTTGLGRNVWIRAIGEPDRDARGTITHVRGALQDVSRFRMVADEARLTAERFTRTLESLTDGFVLLDHDWCFVYVNPEAERILRRERDALTGRSLLAEFPETLSGVFRERCEAAVRAGKAAEFVKFYPPLGIWVYMKVSASDLGLTFCIRDDTDRINARREVMHLKAQLAEKGTLTPV